MFDIKENKNNIDVFISSFSSYFGKDLRNDASFPKWKEFLDSIDIDIALKTLEIVYKDYEQSKVIPTLAYFQGEYLTQKRLSMYQDIDIKNNFCKFCNNTGFVFVLHDRDNNIINVNDIENYDLSQIYTSVYPCTCSFGDLANQSLNETDNKGNIIFNNSIDKEERNKNFKNFLPIRTKLFSILQKGINNYE